MLAETGRIDRNKIKIIWKSQPLPNDPIMVRGGFPEEMKTRLQKALVDLPADEVEKLLPKNYTGFIASDGSNYAPIEEAGKLVGKLK